MTGGKGGRGRVMDRGKKGVAEGAGHLECNGLLLLLWRRTWIRTTRETGARAGKRGVLTGDRGDSIRRGNCSPSARVEGQLLTPEVLQ